MGENNNSCRIMASKYEGKIPFGRSRCKWSIILKHLKEIGYEGV